MEVAYEPMTVPQTLGVNAVCEAARLCGWRPLYFFYHPVNELDAQRILQALPWANGVSDDTLKMGEWYVALNDKRVGSDPF